MYFEIRASPHTIFEVLTTSSQIRKWFTAKASIARDKGGRYSFVWKNGRKRTGKILDWKKDQSLILEWLQNGENTRVAFWLTPLRGSTLLRFRQTGLPRDLARPVDFISIYAEWVYYLTNLRALVETGSDLRRPRDRP